MPLRYEPSKDVPFYNLDRSNVARQSQNFDAIFENRTNAEIRANNRARFRIWALRFTVALLITLILSSFANIIWQKTQNTLALYYSIEASRSVS